MKHLIVFELKSNWKSLVIWLVCLLGFFGFAMMMFPSFTENASAMDMMLEGFSPEILKALGIDIIDFSKPLDYMAYMFQYMLIAVGAYAILSGANALSKEQSNKTIEFLYARPLTRHTIVWAKFIAAIANLFITGIAFLATVIISLAIYADAIEWHKALRLCTGMFLFMLIFMSLGFVLGHFLIKATKRMSTSLGVLFLSFFLSVMGAISEKLSFLNHLTPFYYYDAMSIMHRGFDPKYLLVTGLIVVGSLLFVWKAYERKDLYV